MPPSCEEDELSKVSLSDIQIEALDELRASLYAGSPRHQIGGYPAPIQSPCMDMECQLASHGLYCGDATGYQDARAVGLGSGASDWRLLLQMDSDDDLDAMWGDEGMVYFWVRAEDASKGDFDNAWLILQCH
ncbi:MAG: DUF1963 domain-containing protein [Phycisphaerales bacterium]|nr:DUF1963 domain-containing protein [Phycisphaerales bacterium]